MAAHALHSLIPFRVLFDAKLEFVKRYHLSRLSETIVFDSKWNVKYQGPLDDQLTQGSIKPRPMRRFVKNALDAILAGKEVAVPRLPAVGCMISPLRRDYPHVTFYKDAAPIFQNRCEVCHHEGAVGPMPLTTYKEICDYSGMIEEVVVDRRMPPWPGSSPHGFARSEELRSEESDTIIAWIRNGMKLGNPANAPEAKTWPKRNEWGIGKPDFVFTMPAPITVPAGGFIDYVYVPIEINGGRGFDDDRWIEAIEAQPGAPQVVHHIQIHEFHGTTLSGKVSPLDQLRLYGLSIENARQLGSYAPGNTFENARIYSNYIQAARVAGKRVAMRLPQGSNLMLEMHYTPNGKSVQDQSEVAIRFAKSKPDLELEVWYSFRKRADLVIPANIENHTLEDIYHFGSHTDGKAVLIHAMEPHMHVRGKSFRLELVNAGAVNPRDMQDFRGRHAGPWRGNSFRPRLGFRLGKTLSFPGTDSRQANASHSGHGVLGQYRATIPGTRIPKSTWCGDNKRSRKCSIRCSCMKSSRTMIRACTLRRPWGQNKEMKIVAFAVFCFSFLNLSCAESFDAEAALRAEAAASRSMTASLRELESLTGGPAADPLGWKRYLHWDEWAAPMLEGRAVSVATLENIDVAILSQCQRAGTPGLCPCPASIGAARFSAARHGPCRSTIHRLRRRAQASPGGRGRRRGGDERGGAMALPAWTSPGTFASGSRRLQQFARNLQVPPRSDRRAA